MSATPPASSPGAFVSEVVPTAAGSGAPRYRRRQFLIDPAMQARYFFTMVGLTGVVAFAVVFISAHYFLIPNGGAPLSLDEAALNSRLLHTAIGASIFAMLVLPISSLFVSHRIAGPAYRLRKSAQQVSEGDFGFRIHLRKHDYLKPTADAFNAMLERLEQRQSQSDQNRWVAQAAIVSALKKIAADDPQSVDEGLRLLEEAVARLE